MRLKPHSIDVSGGFNPFFPRLVREARDTGGDTAPDSILSEHPYKAGTSNLINWNFRSLERKLEAAGRFEPPNKDLAVQGQRVTRSYPVLPGFTHQKWRKFTLKIVGRFVSERGSPSPLLHLRSVSNLTAPLPPDIRLSRPFYVIPHRAFSEESPPEKF
jgi:hypothetical protein